MELKEFQNKEFGKIQTATINDKIWFLAKDVCDILEVKNTTVALQALENFEVTKFNLGGLQGETNFISESGFYTLVLRSRKPIAKPFRLWVTQEVLPQIRQTGGYIPLSPTDTDQEILAKAVLISQKTIENKDKIIENLNTRIQDLEPKAQAYIDMMTAQGYLQFIDVAGMVEIGRNTLMQFLRNHKVLTKQSSFNVPYDRFRKNGCFKVICGKTEQGKITSVTMVSPKGLNYIYKLIHKYNSEKDFDTSKLLQEVQA